MRPTLRCRLGPQSFLLRLQDPFLPSLQAVIPRKLTYWSVHTLFKANMVDRGGKSIFVAFWRTMELCSGPSVFMFFMSFAIFIKPPSVTFVNAMQHFGRHKGGFEGNATALSCGEGWQLMS